MAIALVANTGKGSTTGGTVTTDAINTTGANLIVVAGGDYSVSALGAPTDNKSNGSATARTSYTSVSGAHRITLFYWLNPTVGTGHTITWTKAIGFMSVAVAAFSGVKITSPYDAENGLGTTTGTSIQPGSITPAEDGELIVSGLSLQVNNSPSINSSFAITDYVNFGANNYSAGLAYLIQSVAAAINPTWSWGTTSTRASSQASFKAEPVAASSLPRRSKVISQALNFSTNW